jgi:hypothetical protein
MLEIKRRFGIPCREATPYAAANLAPLPLTAPADTAGPADVTVTTSGGTSATAAADVLTYVAAPVVTSIPANVGPVNGGNTGLIAGSGFTGATALQFGATAASNVVVSTDGNQITAAAPAGAPSTTVDVTVTTTTAGGASATSAKDKFIYS